LLPDLPRRRAQLPVLLVVVGDRAEDEDRLALRRPVVEREDGEPPNRRVVVVGRELVQERPDVVHEPGMIAREQLEREERRAAARGALVLEAAPQELGLLPVAELPDRPVRDGALAVVGGPRLALDLVLPLRAQLCELALRALLRERGRLGSG